MVNQSHDGAHKNNNFSPNQDGETKRDDISGSLFNVDFTPIGINRHENIGTHSNYTKYHSKRNQIRTGSLMGSNPASMPMFLGNQ